MLNIEEKICKFCKKVKSISEFVEFEYHIRKCCKECYQTDKLKFQREKDSISKQKRYLRNKLHKDYKRKNEWNWALYKYAQQRAREHHLDFTIKPSDIIVPKICPVLGIELKQSEGKPNDNSPTLDRLNPNLGYIKENICVMSNRANRLKNNGSLEEHEKVLSFLKNHSGCVDNKQKTDTLMENMSNENNNKQKVS